MEARSWEYLPQEGSAARLTEDSTQAGWPRALTHSAALPGAPSGPPLRLVPQPGFHTLPSLPLPSHTNSRQTLIPVSSERKACDELIHGFLFPPKSMTKKSPPVAKMPIYLLIRDKGPQPCQSSGKEGSTVTTNGH